MYRVVDGGCDERPLHRLLDAGERVELYGSDRGDAVEDRDELLKRSPASTERDRGELAGFYRVCSQMLAAMIAAASTLAATMALLSRLCWS